MNTGYSLDKLRKIIFQKSNLFVFIDVMTKAASFLILPLYLHIMSKSMYGEFSSMLISLVASTSILSVGIQVPLIKYFSILKDRKKIDSAISQCIIFFAATLSILIVISTLSEDSIKIFGKTFSINQNIEEKYNLYIFSSYLMTINFIFNAFLIARQNYKIASIIILVKFLAFNGLSILLLKYADWPADDSVSRMYAVLLSEFIPFLICWVIYIKFNSSFFRFSVPRVLLREGIPMVLANASYFIISISDRYFLSQNYGAAYLANYNVSMQFAGMLQMLMFSINSVWQPYFFKISSIEDSLANAFRYFKLSSIALLCGSFFIYAATYCAIYINIIPQSYKDINYYIAPSCLAVSVTLLNQIPFNFIIKYKNPKPVAFFSTVAMALTVLNGLIIIPQFGALGAVYGSAFIAFFILSVSTWLCIRLIQVDLKALD